jgi:type I restriction enzyme S subunit
VVEKSSRDDNANRTPEDLSSYQLVKVGDLVINKMKAWQGSLGVSQHMGITSPDYVVYSPFHAESSRFLHHFLRNKLLASVYLTLSNGIRPSQWRLEPERFENLVVFVPPGAEQMAICDYVDRATRELDDLVALIASAVDRLRELRTALISAAVTGKIDVREEAA